MLRAYRGLPKNGALIKFLSEPGVRALLQKTESYYLQDQQKEMPKVDAELYFTIDEKQNSIELAEKGVDLISSDTNDPQFFILTDVGSLIAEFSKSRRQRGRKRHIARTKCCASSASRANACTR